MFGVHLEGALIDLSGSVLVRREAAPPRRLLRRGEAAKK